MEKKTKNLQKKVLINIEFRSVFGKCSLNESKDRLFTKKGGDWYEKRKTKDWR
mgnify:CR=1 FL=1